MERLDDLCVDGMKIFQDPEEFCFGTDAVLLARFAARKKFRTAADLCCGSGVVPLLLSAFFPTARLWGVDVSPRQVELARRSVEYNGRSDRIQILQTDLREAELGGLDLVTVNPPYFPVGGGLAPRAESRRLARTEVACALSDVVRKAASILRPGGRFAVVHRPERLAELVDLCREVRLEPKVLQLVFPTPDREPELLLLEAARDAGTGMRISPPIFLNDGI